jgi:hypothetical protein
MLSKSPLRTRSRNRVDSRGEADVVHWFTLAVSPALSCALIVELCMGYANSDEPSK